MLSFKVTIGKSLLWTLMHKFPQVNQASDNQNSPNFFAMHYK